MSEPNDHAEYQLQIRDRQITDLEQRSKEAREKLLIAEEHLRLIEKESQCDRCIDAARKGEILLEAEYGVAPHKCHLRIARNYFIEPFVGRDCGLGQGSGKDTRG